MGEQWGEMGISGGPYTMGDIVANRFSRWITGLSGSIFLGEQRSGPEEYLGILAVRKFDVSQEF